MKKSVYKVGDNVVLKSNGFGQTITGRDNGEGRWIIQECGNGPCRTVRDEEIEFDPEDAG